MTAVPEKWFVWREYLIIGKYAWDLHGNKVELPGIVDDVYGDFALIDGNRVYEFVGHESAIFKMAWRHTLNAMVNTRLCDGYYTVYGEPHNFDGSKRERGRRLIALPTGLRGDVEMPTTSVYDGNGKNIGTADCKTIKWTDDTRGTVAHACPNPCGSTEGTFTYKGGWWEVRKDNHRYIATDGLCPSALQLAAFEIHPYGLPCPRVVRDIVVKFPFELCDIVNSYLGNSWTVWATPCDDRAIVRNGITIQTTGGKLRIRDFGKPDLIFDMSAWDIFENHLIVKTGSHVFVVDLDNLKPQYTAIPLTDMTLACGQHSFNLGYLSYSYEFSGEPPHLMESCAYVSESSSLARGDVGLWHYTEDCSVLVAHPYCERGCTFPCLKVEWFHVNVPAFGKCAIYEHRKDSVVLIALIGLQGIHFQIHNIADGAAPGGELARNTLISYCDDNTHSFPTTTDIIFAGDVLSLRDVNKKWISFSFFLRDRSAIAERS
jgi:hypothetical protein